VTLVRAAGGIVVDDAGRVLVVHRPHHGDWSLPKGKLEDGESWEEAAVREVEEETGLRCTAGPEVGRTSYRVPAGPKEVRYFRMRAEGEATAQNEVDEVRWVTPAEARELLDYADDRELVRMLLEAGS
jgi:8-oxo-dGTP diphosphatase